jgi:hypothetical protein
MINRDDILEQETRNKEAALVKKQQDKIRKKFEYLAKVEKKLFQSEYIKAQANEICSYAKYVKLLPFKGWHSSLLAIINEPTFLYNNYLMINEFGEIEPDLKRIESLVLPEPIDIDAERNAMA